jgi:hypothetical protein
MSLSFFFDYAGYFGSLKSDANSIGFNAITLISTLIADGEEFKVPELQDINSRIGIR